MPRNAQSVPYVEIPHRARNDIFREVPPCTYTCLIPTPADRTARTCEGVCLEKLQISPNRRLIVNIRNAAVKDVSCWFMIFGMFTRTRFLFMCNASNSSHTGAGGVKLPHVSWRVDGLKLSWWSLIDSYFASGTYHYYIGCWIDLVNVLLQWIEMFHPTPTPHYFCLLVWFLLSIYIFALRF